MGECFGSTAACPGSIFQAHSLHAAEIVHQTTNTALQLHALGGCSNPCCMTRSTMGTSSFRDYLVENGDFSHWSCLDQARKVAPKHVTCRLDSQKHPQEVQLQMLCKLLCVQPSVSSEPGKSGTGRGEEVRRVTGAGSTSQPHVPRNKTWSQNIYIFIYLGSSLTRSNFKYPHLV